MTVSTQPYTTNDRSRRAVSAFVPLALAAFLLLSSVVAAAWLVKAAPTDTWNPSAEHLQAQSGHVAYGGDAYTGIQNAAADTEHAVVVGSNAVTDLVAAEHKDRSIADAERWAHLWKAIAVLMVLLAGANFVIVLQRHMDVRRPDLGPQAP
jgi:hypothetical protein